MIKFYYNGIKDDGGRLQRVQYSAGQLRNHPEGTVSLYKRDYGGFSAGIRAAFAVENASDSMSDYYETDTIRVRPDHQLYEQVRSGYSAQQARRVRRDGY